MNKKKILIIKLSSIGDLIHTFPAISDLQQHQPELEVDWLVDASLKEIPTWHPFINKVYPLSLRARKLKVVAEFLQVRKNNYDLIIDAQGLLKSAVTAKLLQAKIISGFAKSSIKEQLAVKFYQQTHDISKDLHAISRLRLLCAHSLNYTVDLNKIVYGLNLAEINTAPYPTLTPKPYVVFFYGTTWETKHWPPNYWKQLALLLGRQGFEIQLTYSNLSQERFAKELAIVSNAVRVLPPITLNQSIGIIKNAHAVVSVDTGFGHIADAMGGNLVALYGPTDYQKVGMQSNLSKNLFSKFSCAPCQAKKCTYKGYSLVQPACFAELTPQMVCDAIAPLS